MRCGHCDEDITTFESRIDGERIPYCVLCNVIEDKPINIKDNNGR